MHPVKAQTTMKRRNTTSNGTKNTIVRCFQKVGVSFNSNFFVLIAAFVCAGEIVAEINAWINESDVLNLQRFAHIEAKVATKFDAPDFTDLGHKSFLHLLTHHPDILKVLESSALQIGLQSEKTDMSDVAQFKNVAKEHVHYFLHQCDLTRSVVRQGKLCKL